MARHLRHWMISISLAGSLLLAGCSGVDQDNPDGSGSTGSTSAGSAQTRELLAAHDLDGMEATEIVDHLDRLSLAERPTDLMASVQPGALVLTSDGTEATLPLPEDRFYLSVAPYVETTHDCFHHSLTTCKGELSSEPVDVTITDEQTGETLVDETVTTFDNGFAGFWLPRDVEATVRIDHDGRSGEVSVVTGESDPTCLTTLRLT